MAFEWIGSTTAFGDTVLPDFFFLTISVRLKPKSASLLQRFDAFDSAGQTASLF